ncbi:hypothetical protein BRADI_3g56763v3 [Brachypodium distachyon]|uniref:Late embryogenesis abundant protein LEA-2 subgroup domain-containing protein n=1 Tax=Brachypodium distachyon TaxID=15368 RepID=A0A0Q3FU28_BRADI|nr:hypothetical protein BRADI_3g56763v3 [Brachypodium distachyon]
MGADEGRWTRGDTKSCFCFLTILIIVVSFVLFMVLGTPSPNYYVAIDSVCGLDFLPVPSTPPPPSSSPPPPPPANTDLVMNPVFNLTLRVNSGSPGCGACLHARTYIEVSYRCFPVAVTPVLPEDLCVGPKKSADWHVTARGAGVRLPGFMVDGLVADVRAGTEAFEITLKRAGNVAACGLSRVGDAMGRRAGEDGYGESCGVRRVGDAVRKCHLDNYDCPAPSHKTGTSN